MSHDWRQRAYAVETATVFDRFVLVVLGEHANRRGLAWPSLARIAAMTGMSERGVRMCLRRLEAAGLISTRRSVGGQSRTSVYCLTLDEAPVVEGASPPRDTDEDGDADRALDGRWSADPEPGTACRVSATNPARHDPEPGTACPRTLKKIPSPPPAREADELAGRVREAAGAAPGGRWSDHRVRIHLDRWLAQGLSEAEVLGEAARIAERRGEPPGGPEYFTPAMMMLAAVKSSPPNSIVYISERRADERRKQRHAGPKETHVERVPRRYLERTGQHSELAKLGGCRPRPVQICQHALDARRAARERLGLDRAPEPEPAPAGPRAPLTGEALAQHNAALRRLPPAMLARIAPELLAPIEPMTDDAGSEP